MPRISSVVMGLGVPAAATVFFGSEILDQKKPFADDPYREQLVLATCEEPFSINGTTYKIGEVLAEQAPIITFAENDEYITIELQGKHVTFTKDCPETTQKIAEAPASIHTVSFQR